MRRSAVQAYWEQAPCGTRELVAPEELARWAELERTRYRREPFIHRFAAFGDARGRDVLEVGCGAGTDLLQFARSGARAKAVDLTAAGATLATRRLRAEGFTAAIARADAERLPFPDASFDVVYSWGVIHHTPDTRAAAAEILRVLRPGGRFTVMIYNRRSLLALQAWLVYGLGRGRPGARVKDLLASHVESPGTKAYSRAEALAIFPGTADLRLETVVTPYDLRLGRRLFLPSFVARLVPARLGWFHVLSGTTTRTSG